MMQYQQALATLTVHNRILRDAAATRECPEYLEAAGSLCAITQVGVAAFHRALCGSGEPVTVGRA
jgi:hypothetical protein